MKEEIFKVALVGAGYRGRGAHGAAILQNRHLARYVAVADPDDVRRTQLADEHDIPEKMRFKSLRDMLDARPEADAVFNCTQDAMHAESALDILNAGYHQLLEKPMAVNALDCVRIVKCAEANKRVLALTHGLRYAPFFQEIRKLVLSGRIGRVLELNYSATLAYWHFITAYVRGPYRSSVTGSPLILAKCCHDLDQLIYLTGKRPLRVSSFGGLSWFRPENAPDGAPERCMDGCPAERDCPFSAMKLHLHGDREWIHDAGMLGSEPTVENKIKHLRESPFGLCVYRAGNDVVDHQVAAIEFEDGLTVNFSVHAFGPTTPHGQTLRFGGTEGNLRAAFQDNRIEVDYFLGDGREIITPRTQPGGHGGGDTALLLDFVRAVQTRDSGQILTNIHASLDSHLLGFAAEESRLNNGQVVNIAEYRAGLEEKI